jgi:hypothetical protein
MIFGEYNILGVDPGIRGGLAIIGVPAVNAPRLIDAIDIPVTGIGVRGQLFALVQGTPGQIEKPPATAKQALDQFAGTNQPVPQITAEKPSLATEMNDEIPDFSESVVKPAAAAAVEPKKAPAQRPTARRDLKKQSASTKAASRSTTRRRLTNMDAG